MTMESGQNTSCETSSSAAPAHTPSLNAATLVPWLVMAALSRLSELLVKGMICGRPYRGGDPEEWKEILSGWPEPCPSLRPYISSFSSSSPSPRPDPWPSWLDAAWGLKAELCNRKRDAPVAKGRRECASSVAILMVEEGDLIEEWGEDGPDHTAVFYPALLAAIPPPPP